MSKREIETVLANWIREAISSEGVLLPKGIAPEAWITKRFFAYWREQAVAEAVGDAEVATARVRDELNAVGGFNNPQLGEAMHELIHLSDALGEIRQWLGLHGDVEPEP